MVNENNLNTTNEEPRLNITPKSDIIFKNIFGNEKNKKILETLLEAILNKKVKVSSVQKSKELEISNINNKIGILDVQAMLKDGSFVNIEMQNQKYVDYHKRVMYYLGKLITDQIKKSESYSKIKDIILINILGYKLPDCNKIISKYELNNIKDFKDKIEGVTLYFVQIPKFEEKIQKLLKMNLNYEDMIKTALDEWCVYFSYKDKEMLKMVEVKNMNIEEAVKLYEELIEREEVVSLYTSRLIAEMDRRAWEETVKEKEVILEELKKQNKKVIEDKEKLKKQNKKVMEDKEKTITQIITNLLQQNLSKDIILKVTGVSEERFEKVKLAFNN